MLHRILYSAPALPVLLFASDAFAKGGRSNGWSRDLAKIADPIIFHPAFGLVFVACLVACVISCRGISFREILRDGLPALFYCFMFFGAWPLAGLMGFQNYGQIIDAAPWFLMPVVILAYAPYGVITIAIGMAVQFAVVLLFLAAAAAFGVLLCVFFYFASVGLEGFFAATGRTVQPKCG